MNNAEAFRARPPFGILLSFGFIKRKLATTYHLETLTMRKNCYFVLAACFSLFLSTVSLWAHHSAAATYDISKKFTLSGTVSKLEWKNPHIFFYIDVKDEAGKVTTWAIESTAPNQLYRAGWRKQDLNIGDTVTLKDSSPARDGTKKAYGGKLTLADGRTVFSGSAAEDR